MSDMDLAHQIAQAAQHFEQQITGYAPKSVTVVLSDQALVVVIHGELSAAELEEILESEGAKRVQDFYRQLFMNTSYSVRQEIERISGVEVREATAEVDVSTGTIVKVFTTGTVAQVVLLARNKPGE